jgi:hypothetical protein
MLGPQVIAVATVVLLIIVLLLDWVSGGGEGAKLWKTTTTFGHRPPIFLFVMIAFVLALAAAHLAGQTQLRPWLGAMGLILFGYVFELVIEWGPLSGSNGFGASVSNGAVGPWLALICGLAIVVGAALTLDLRASALGGVAVGLRQAAGNVSAAAQSRASAAGVGADSPGTATTPSAAATPSTAATDATAATPTATAPAVSPAPDGPADVAGASPPGWYPDPSGQHRERKWDGTSWTDDTR